MTRAAVYYLICDGCGLLSSEGEDDWATARRLAREVGWTHTPRRLAGALWQPARDYCRRCALEGDQ